MPRGFRIMLHAPLNVVLARRAASPRRGSVLIMVVAVLVLLALMGTAYISVVRIDRLNAGSSAVRPPVAAIVAAADDALTKDLYGTAAGPVLYRPPGDPGTVGYEHYDSNIPVTTLPAPARSHDPWLADRVPMLINVDANGNGSIDTTASSTNVEQNMPAWWATTELSLPFEDVETGTRLTFPPAQRFAFVPTSKTVTYTSGLGTDSSPKQYPAFRIARLVDPTSVPNMTWQYVGFYDPDGGGALPLGWYPVNSNSASWAATQPRDWNDYLYIAADADADGIADSLLFRMPGPGAAGQTFYGAVRIVDNNSAININTAWSNESDYRADGGADDNGIAYAASNRYDAFGNAIVGTNAGTKLGMFPSHVGLIQILSTYTLPGGGAPPTSTEMNRLNNERFNGYASPGSVDQTENPPRTDFGHATAGDAMYTQAGRRLDNPGAIATDPGPPVSKVAYKPLSAGDGAALAARAGSMLLNLDKYNLDPNNAALLSPKFRASNTTTVGGQVFTAHRVDYLFHDSAYLLVLNHVGATTTSENNVFNVFPSSRPGYWFDWNYNYPTPGATTTVWSNPFSTTTPTYPAPGAAKPIRSLITSRNPVSTYVPKHTVTTGDVPVVGMMPYAASLIPTWDPDPTVTYTPGQLVKVDVDPPNGTWRVYRRLETAPATPPNPAPAPFAGTGSASDNAWDEEHWTGEGTSVRASANKSGFAELWRAFWNVMASTGPVPTGYLFATPFDVEYDAALTDVANTAEWEYDPYVGMKFVTGTFAPDSTTVLP
ncbi:MAG TPA: hypothetical protein VK324_16925, partial [Tepidisphaeraceae bacterium]|nr:hypothetical protein [Tepidisphaeraceae bacterium]